MDLSKLNVVFIDIFLEYNNFQKLKKTLVQLAFFKTPFSVDLVYSKIRFRVPDLSLICLEKENHISEWSTHCTKHQYITNERN